MGNTASEDAALAAGLSSDKAALHGNVRVERVKAVFNALDKNKDGSVDRTQFLGFLHTDEEVRILLGLSPLLGTDRKGGMQIEQVFTPLMVNPCATLQWAEAEAWLIKILQERPPDAWQGNPERLVESNGAMKEKLPADLYLDTLTMWEEVSALSKDPNRLQEQCTQCYQRLRAGQPYQQLMKPVLRDMASHFIGLFDAENRNEIYQAVDRVCPDASSPVDFQMYYMAEYAILLKIEQDLRERLANIRNGDTAVVVTTQHSVNGAAVPAAVAPTPRFENSCPRMLSAVPESDQKYFQPPPTNTRSLEVLAEGSPVQMAPPPTEERSRLQQRSSLDHTSSMVTSESELNVTMASQGDPAIERMKAEICAGNLWVKIYKVGANGDYHLEEKRLAVHPGLGSMAIFGDGGELLKGFETEEVDGILPGIPSGLLENPPPREMALAFRFRKQPDERDQYFCVLFDNPELCQLSTFAFSELCNAPIISEGMYR
mmetsp:Transcript_56252/g.131773  ORF Transcript_56252/g.131773 Transcript_56252/m.131773 type:complete len:487 (+) Transcript_56252:25-1485(+)